MCIIVKRFHAGLLLAGSKRIAGVSATAQKFGSRYPQFYIAEFEVSSQYFCCNGHAFCLGFPVFQKMTITLHMLSLAANEINGSPIRQRSRHFCCWVTLISVDWSPLLLPNLFWDVSQFEVCIKTYIWLIKFSTSICQAFYRDDSLPAILELRVSGSVGTLA